MCRDGLLPKQFAAVSPRFGTPARLTLTIGAAVALLAAFVPLSEIVTLVNIGTLFAFVLVNVGVIVLRRTRPDMKRPFKVPFSPVVPGLGTVLCVYLMKDLPLDAWLRFAVWLLVGLLVYGVYGYRHSRLRAQEPAPRTDSGRPTERGTTAKAE